MTTPYFSIVVPTYNRIDRLQQVLRSLDAQKGAPAFEVVVVNDGSKDNTAEVIEKDIAASAYRFPFQFVTQENSGPGKARNRGVAMSSGKFVIFVGDDTVPESQFLAEHARVHHESGEDPLVACLGYTGWPAGERVTSFMDYINDYGLQFGYRLIQHDTVVPFNFFYTSNISIDRQLLAEHPFDTSFPAAAWEDIELAYRLEHLGLKIRYNARAVTRHYHQMTVDSFSRRQYTVGKSGAIFFQKHPELGHFLGVYELRDRKMADEKRLRRLRRVARIGEAFRPFTRTSAYEALMREYYLRGLRDGLAEVESAAQSG